jgi:plastocyanin
LVEMQAVRFKSSMGIILVVAAFAGCGGSDSGTGDVKPDNSETVHVKPGSNVPQGGTVETAKVLEKVQKGIPAQRGQWMVDVGVAPEGDLAYTVARVIAPLGNTNFRLENPQAEGHDLTIEEVGGGHVKTPIVREGSRWTRVSLFAGKKYVFYCSVPGHREAGMEGLIEVNTSLSAEDLKPF